MGHNFSIQSNHFNHLHSNSRGDDDDDKMLDSIIRIYQSVFKVVIVCVCAHRQLHKLHRFNQLKITISITMLLLTNGERAGATKRIGEIILFLVECVWLLAMIAAP